MIHSIEIPHAALKAAALFVSKDDLRYVLTGIHLCTLRDRLLMVATDGRCMLIQEIAPFYPQEIKITFFPPQLLHTGSRLLHAQVEIDTEANTITWHDGVKGANSFRLLKMDMLDPSQAYPNWQHVAIAAFTESVPMKCWSYNADYLARFQQAAACFSEAAALEISNRGNGPFIIRAINHPSFLGLQMPMADRQEKDPSKREFKMPAFISELQAAITASVV